MGVNRYDWSGVDWERDNNVEIARQLGCSIQAVTERRSRNGHPPSPGRGEARYVRYRQLIDLLYVERGVSAGVIAETLGLNPKVLSTRISNWGLPEIRLMRERDLAEEEVAEWEE